MIGSFLAPHASRFLVRTIPARLFPFGTAFNPAYVVVRRAPEDSHSMHTIYRAPWWVSWRLKEAAMCTSYEANPNDAVWDVFSLFSRPDFE
jgi:hypothetical protein